MQCRNGNWQGTVLCISVAVRFHYPRKEKEIVRKEGSFPSYHSHLKNANNCFLPLLKHCAHTVQEGSLRIWPWSPCRLFKFSASPFRGPVVIAFEIQVVEPLPLTVAFFFFRQSKSHIHHEPKCIKLSHLYRRVSHGLGWPANAILFLPSVKGNQKLRDTSAPTASNIAHQTNLTCFSFYPIGRASHNLVHRWRPAG